MNVKIRRIQMGLTQRDLCKILGMSNATIVKIEKGELDSIRIGTLTKVADALGMSIKELFFENEK